MRTSRRAVHQVAELRRDALQAETLGLQLAEAKELLARVQEVVVEEQVRACLAKVACPHCGRPRRHKDERSIALRSLFGTLRLPSPRWHHCPRGPWARRKKGMRIEGHHAAAQLLVGVDAELAKPIRWPTVGNHRLGPLPGAGNSSWEGSLAFSSGLPHPHRPTRTRANACLSILNDRCRTWPLRHQQALPATPERTTPELLYLEARFAGLIVVRTERQPPGRAPAARTFIASHLGPPSRPGHGAAPGGGAGTRAGDVHRGLPQGLGRSCRSRTCRSRSASTAGTSMPATSDLAVRGGST